MRRVTLVGRRGPVQAAFTIAEFREIAEMKGVRTIMKEDEMRVGEEDVVGARESLVVAYKQNAATV